MIKLNTEFVDHDKCNIIYRLQCAIDMDICKGEVSRRKKEKYDNKSQSGKWQREWQKINNVY